MAERNHNRATSVPSAGDVIVAIPPADHLLHADITEQARDIPLQDMESNFAVRNRHGQAARADANETGTSTGLDTLSSNTLADEGCAEDPQIRGILNRLFGNFRAAPKAAVIQTNNREEFEKRYETIPDDIALQAIGIPRFTAFQNSNDSFRIFRKFGNEATRLLVIKQIELQTITTKLLGVNKTDEAADGTTFNNWRLHSINDVGADDEQRKLLKDLETKILAYYELLSKFASIGALQQAKPRHCESVLAQSINTGTFAKGEDSFLRYPHDFVYGQVGQVGQHQSKIEDYLEALAERFPNFWINKLLTGKEERMKNGDTNIRHLSTFWLKLVARVIAAVVGFACLLPPIFLLFLGNLSQGMMAGVVGIFLIVFVVAMSLLVEVTPHDVFLIMLGFAAILVTLLSNSSQGEFFLSPTTV